MFDFMQSCEKPLIEMFSLCILKITMKLAQKMKIIVMHVNKILKISPGFVIHRDHTYLTNPKIIATTALAFVFLRRKILALMKYH